jgi:hypothetical protein
MRRCLSAVVLAGVVVLAGCSSDPEAAGTPCPPPGAPCPSAEHSAGAGHAHDREHVEALPSTAPAPPMWDQAAAGSATQVGLDAMRAFARPDLDADAWYDQLAGYLTPAGQQAFYGTDPAAIEPREVLGTVLRERGPSAYLAEVTAFTDAGDYRLLLVRGGAGEPWKVERLEPVA